MGNLLNIERERERQAKLKSKSDSKTWRPQDGDKNIIRVLTFKHKVTKADVEAKLYGKEELGKTANEWCYPFIVHYGLVPDNRKIPTLSSPEIMEQYFKLKKSKDKDDQKRAQSFYPKKVYAMNIVDINDGGKGVQIFLAPKAVREFVGDHVISQDYGEDVLGIKGRDWRINFDKTAEPKSMYKLLIIPEKSCRPMSSKVEGMVFDLFDPQVNGDFAKARSMDELDIPEGDEAPVKEDLEGEKTPSNGKGDIFDDKE